MPVPHSWCRFSATLLQQSLGVEIKSNDPRLTFAPWALYGDLPTCEQLHPQA